MDVAVIENLPQSFFYTFVSVLVWLDVKLGHVASQQHFHIDAVNMMTLILGDFVAIVVVGQCIGFAVEQVVGNGRLFYLLILRWHKTVCDQWRHECFLLDGPIKQVFDLTNLVPRQFLGSPMAVIASGARSGQRIVVLTYHP